MAKPIANFTFKANGLSVQFTDRSSGIITTYAWDFGYQIAGVEQISNAQNPLVVFPNAGAYNVSLTVTNSFGSSTFTFAITVQLTPGLNISIKQMVQYNLPVGLAFDSIGFDQSIMQWQLYLQLAAEVSDADIFDETKWPPLYNVLISKLIIMDLVVKAATASMASFIAAAESFNSLISSTTTSTIQVADYTINWDGLFPITINLIESNGLPYGPSGALANGGAALTWLNGLSIGQFAFSGGVLQSLGNNNLLTTFNYTSTGGGHNGAFTQTNARVVPITQTIINSGTGIGSKGTLKALETGPSKAQWYDPSAFWSAIFKSTTGAEGAQGGVLGSIQMEICLYAGRLSIKLPGCISENTLVKPFIVAKGKARNGTFPYNHFHPWPPSRGTWPPFCD